MINLEIFSPKNPKQEGNYLGKPTDDMKQRNARKWFFLFFKFLLKIKITYQVFSQISPINANNRNPIFNSKDDCNGYNPFYGGSGLKGDLQFSETKQESTTEENKVTKNLEDEPVNLKVKNCFFNWN